MMKNLFISFLFFTLQLNAFTQTDTSIVIGKKVKIYSEVLKENRNIWIYTPDITSKSANKDKHYPVLFLLDGDAHFFSTVGIVQQLSQANGNGILPEMMVVAIENTDRTRDLIPSADLNKTNPFAHFLTSELIPYIEEHYNAAPYRLLVGHSLGGLTSIDVFTKFPEHFNACIALDPSMWIYYEMFLKNTMKELPKINMHDKRLFIGIANTLPKGMSIADVSNDNSFETQHIRSIFTLDTFLKNNTNGLVYNQKYYEAEGHNSLPLLGTYDGLRFIFDYFHLDLSEKDFADTSALIASTIKEHYVQVSDKLGFKNAAPESFINYLAFDALSKNQLNKAQALFELNIESYPVSGNAYNAYAEYFLARKDTVNAIANYKKALRLDNKPEIQLKMDALISNNSSVPTNVDLKIYTGTYVLESYNMPIRLEIRKGKLWAIVQGQADTELQPLSETIFIVNEKPGYTITFDMENNKPKGFTSVQPNGTFHAVFINKE